MRKSLVIAGAMAFAAPAYAQTASVPPSWYAGVSGGIPFMYTADVAGPTPGKLSMDPGFMGAVSLGVSPNVRFQPLADMRFEAELGYHYNSLDTFTPNGGGATGATGSTRTMSYMANAYYDFRSPSLWTPYIGAGIGGARVQLSRNSGIGNTEASDNVLAYQIMAGLSYVPSPSSMTEWNIGYRYFALNNPEFNTSTGKVKLDSDDSHNLEVGARFHF